MLFETLALTKAGITSSLYFSLSKTLVFYDKYFPLFSEAIGVYELIAGSCFLGIGTIYAIGDSFNTHPTFIDPITKLDASALIHMGSMALIDGIIKTSTLSGTYLLYHLKVRGIIR